MLTRLSRVSQNPFQNSKSCESSITTMYQSHILKNKYVSVSIYHCHRSPFMNPFFITYKNDEWYVFRGTNWSSCAYFILLHACRYFLFLSFFYFLWYLLLAEVLR